MAGALTKLSVARENCHRQANGRSRVRGPNQQRRLCGNIATGSHARVPPMGTSGDTVSAERSLFEPAADGTDPMLRLGPRAFDGGSLRVHRMPGVNCLALRVSSN